jgi:hypothetical protein
MNLAKLLTRTELTAITEGIAACRDPTSFLRLARGGGERARRRISQDASIRRARSLAAHEVGEHAGAEP